MGVEREPKNQWAGWTADLELSGVLMGVKVNIVFPQLLQYTEGQEQVEVQGAAVGECLRDLVRRFPGLQKVLFDKSGAVLDYIYLVVNGTAVYPVDLDAPLRDGDEIAIAVLIGGG